MKTIVFANQEITLCAGAIDSPKLLLLFGIGPAEELQEFDIPVIQDLPGVGKNLHDHLWLELVSMQKIEGHHRSLSIVSPEKFQEAMSQWSANGTGPPKGYHRPQMVGFLSCEKALKSAEFSQFNDATKSLLTKETKPAFEIISVTPSHLCPCDICVRVSAY